MDVVVVGAGHAGLAMSHALVALGIEHVVLERSAIGSTWRGQRWRSFRLNGPASFSALPGLAAPGDQGAFGTADDFVRYLHAYRDAFDLPVRTGETVIATSPGSGPTAETFTLSTSHGDTYVARHVVAATGALNVARLPRVASALSPTIHQLHSIDYSHADALPPGAVLVVGGAQTGCQIAEDLVASGRRVLMATSRVPRLPRRYRGRDIFDWLGDAGYYDQRGDELPDPSVRLLPQPQITAAAGERSTSYQWLAKQGVELFGRLDDVRDAVARFDGNLHEHVRFADEMSRRITSIVDAFIERSGIDAPPPTADPAEIDAGDLLRPTAPKTIDLAAHGVSTVIWCTGVTGDFGWLPREALDAHGVVRHTDGIGEMRGIYIVGVPWLSRRGSGIIPGAGIDAERVARTIAQRLEAKE